MTYVLLKDNVKPHVYQESNVKQEKHAKEAFVSLAVQAMMTALVKTFVTEEIVEILVQLEKLVVLTPCVLPKIKEKYAIVLMVSLEFQQPPKDVLESQIDAQLTNHAHQVTNA